MKNPSHFLLVLFLHGVPVWAQSTPLNSNIDFSPAKPASDSTLFALLNSIDGSEILSLASALAADSMGGRAAGSEGYSLATSWVERYFKQHRAQPLFGSDFSQSFRVATSSLKDRHIYIDNQRDYITTSNVGGKLVEAGWQSRRWIVLTAHLDHLGRSNGMIYNGANDNASGVAVMLSILPKLSQLRKEFNLAFVGFGAEEAGLIGSHYFVNNPPFELDSIALLINLDLVGSGVHGIMLQGIDRFPAYLELARKANKNLFNFEIQTRPNSPNSDHYYFNRRNLPAFFFYAYRGTSPYHHPDDTVDKLDPQVLESVAQFVLAFTWHVADTIQAP